MDWSESVSKITPFIIQIHTQNKKGSGLIFWQNEEYCCIATAYHVVADANVQGWEQPIYLRQPNKQVVRLNPENRTILKLNENINGDSAAIFIRKTGLDFPTDCLPLWDFSQEIPIGTEVGWLGYPVLVDKDVTQPSFFCGTISNSFPSLQQYVIDGVAIHGVSGAPLFCKGGEDGPYIIGTLSSYFTNRVEVKGSFEAWPGVALSHSFAAFDPVVADLKKIEAAKQTSPPVPETSIADNQDNKIESNQPVHSDAPKSGA